MYNENIKILKPFKNAYCDALYCGLGKFLKISDENYNFIVKNLSREELSVICEYVAVKNKLAGVGELNLKTPIIGVGNAALDKYKLKGSEILSANYINGLSTRDLVGDRLILEIEDLNDYNEAALGDIADFVGATQMPILIHFGRDLNSIGLTVNRFGCSPAELLESYGFLDRQCKLYGFNFIDKEDQKLLAQYSPTVILSPISDGEEGKGGINLYNLIYNRLKFVFSSGKCYNIDMLKEAKMAILNTNNLMYQRDLVDFDALLDSIQSEAGEIKINFDFEAIKEALLDEKVIVEDEKLYEKLQELEIEIKKIANRLKEKN
ncbi:MAG: hypothetical protein J6K97_00570 [Clostridia bacterium]|nr:hypothetical protein [Clostridia bacterium]